MTVHRRRHLVELLSERACTNGSDICFTWLDSELNKIHEITYSELYRKSICIGIILLDEVKVKKGDRVLLCYPPGVEFIFSFFGCLYAGVIPVPVSPPDPLRISTEATRLCDICTQTNAVYSLTDSIYHIIVNVISSQCTDRRWLGLQWLCTDVPVNFVTDQLIQNFKLSTNILSSDECMMQLSGLHGCRRIVSVSSDILMLKCQVCIELIGFDSNTDDPNTSLCVSQFPPNRYSEFIETRNMISLKKEGS
eukprot:GHVR01149130.1.p1 GENE.GHVR01149130.1~~GHVR01149130.1.p1  ORF type:complete len:251 (+),score=35.21 GHVR01149130.1:75-827(+)